ncbi:ester cyclase [Streptomyces pseudogriseolus]|uniref:ester cyclase n=2 Tax=Streptomyces pseudogriseolus TaxID=36817 RepID=UPI001CE23C24|nr:ester cyclase [Streptomyces pseudogriseolus]
MSMRPTELARGLFRVLETGDPALAADVVHDRFVNREAAVAPAACSLSGPAGVLASSAWLRTAYENLRLPVDAVADDGDRVWVRLRMQGRHTGPFVRYREGRLDQAVPPTGRDIDCEQIHVLDLREGRIVGHEAVRDDMTMLQQLGVFPPSPAVALRMAAWKVTGRAARAAEEVTRRAAEAASSA